MSQYFPFNNNFPVLINLSYPCILRKAFDFSGHNLLMKDAVV